LTPIVHGQRWTLEEGGGVKQALAYDIQEVTVVAKVGRTAVYEAMNSGDLRAVKRGRRTLILEPDLQRWLKSLPVFVPKTRVAR
jgi:excisionase family DNA binding protein